MPKNKLVVFLISALSFWMASSLVLDAGMTEWVLALPMVIVLGMMAVAKLDTM